MLLEGTASCIGGIEIQVRKLVAFLDDGDDPLVQTEWYSYNVTLRGVGNIFRYDSPFLPDRGGHHAHDHVHLYDAFAGDREGTIEPIYNKDDVPTLGEVIDRARDWYWQNVEELERRGLA